MARLSDYSGLSYRFIDQKNLYIHHLDLNKLQTFLFDFLYF